jgi:hypothetical protein
MPMTQTSAETNAETELAKAERRRAKAEKQRAIAREGARHRREFLERLEVSSLLRATDADSAQHTAAPPNLDDLDLIARQIERLLTFRLIEPEGFSILHIGCGDGELLYRLTVRFPQADLHGVECSRRARLAGDDVTGRPVHLYRVDLDELFLSHRQRKDERFDVAILADGFDAPAGPQSSHEPQWADGWLGKQTAYTFGRASRSRLRELKERGAAYALERPRSNGALACWTEDSLLPRRHSLWAGHQHRSSPFLGWLAQNARRHGMSDALYYAGHLVLAVVDGRLPRTAFRHRWLRTRFCATLHGPRQGLRPKTVYVFVFLGEFGYELLNGQGVVRRLAAALPTSSAIVVAGRRGLQPFYETAAQYIEVDDIDRYRDSYAAAYFAMAPDQSRRHRPPTDRQFKYDRELRRSIEDRVRARLPDDGRRVEFVFSTELSDFGEAVFGVDPRFYGLRASRGSIYANLDVTNNRYEAIAPVEQSRDEIEAKLGFSLDEPYVFVQSRRRVIGPQSGGELNAGPLISEIARRCRVVELSFGSGRHLESDSAGALEGVSRYETASFQEQSCLIGHARRCVLLTEGDLGSHAYLPPLMGRDAVVVARAGVFARASAPVEFWNRNVFRFGGQMITLPVEQLDSPVAMSTAAHDIVAGDRRDQAPSRTRRILFLMRHAGYVRNCEHVIDQLAERGHAVHIAVAMPSPKAHDREVLAQLSERWANVTHGFSPKLAVRFWDDAIALKRLLIDYLRYLKPDYADAPLLRARAARRLPRAVVTGFDRFALLRDHRVLRGIDAFLRFAEWAAPTHLEADEFLAERRPDLVALTPLLDTDSNGSDYIKSARRLGIRTALCVASWDNLSNKGLVQLPPDRVILWNAVQHDEAVRMHGIEHKRIRVTGAHLYDHWFRMRTSNRREDFCRARGLPPDRPFVLYVCSSGFVAEREVAFIKRWIGALRAAGPPLADCGILVRPHAGNPTEWRDADFSPYRDLAVWPQLGESPLEEKSKQNYFDSLAHASAVVGINTSALIEAGIAGTPVFTVLDDEFRDTQIGTVHFHYLVKGRLLTTASDLQEHAGQLKHVLAAGDAERGASQKRFVTQFVRPHGLDRPASPIAVEALESLVNEHAAAERPSEFSLTREAARLALFPLAALTHAYISRQRTQGVRHGVGLINRRRAQGDFTLSSRALKHRRKLARRESRFRESRIRAAVTLRAISHRMARPPL